MTHDQAKAIQAVRRDGARNKLNPGDSIRCADRDDLIDTITALVADGVEVRVVDRLTLNVEAVT